MRLVTLYGVDRYTPADWPNVCKLLSNWPFKPLTGHSAWPADVLTALCLTRAAAILDSDRTVAWLADSGGVECGLTSFTEVPWDSTQLGISAARLDYLVATGCYDKQYRIKQTLLAAALKHAARKDIHHLSIRLDASDLSGLHALESAGFITVDNILTFALDLGQEPLQGEVVRQVKSDRPKLRMASRADSEAVGALARTAYVYDRFHADPAISSRQADSLHAEWLRNSCAGTAADAVVLAEDEEGLLGFVTCKLQHDTKTHLDKLIGTIVLVATARRAGGKGIGRITTLAALNWFRDQRTDIVEVGTQLRNIPASRLYQGCGFRLAGSSVSLRKRC